MKNYGRLAQLSFANVPRSGTFFQKPFFVFRARQLAWRFSLLSASNHVITDISRFPVYTVSGVGMTANIVLDVKLDWLHEVRQGCRSIPLLLTTLRARFLFVLNIRFYPPKMTFAGILLVSSHCPGKARILHTPRWFWHNRRRGDLLRCLYMREYRIVPSWCLA